MVALAGPLDRLNERPESQNEYERSANQQGGVGAQDTARRLVEAPANFRADTDPQEQQAEHQASPNEDALLGDRYAQGIMAIAAVIATAVAALTLLLLYLTFQQTEIAARYAARTFGQSKEQTRIAKKSARKAQRISRDQSRAYVHVSEAIVSVRKGGFWPSALGAITGEEYEYMPSLRLKFENVGGTPTTAVKYYAKALTETGFIQFMHRLVTFKNSHVIQNLAPRSDRTLPALAENLVEAVNTFYKRRSLGFGAGLLGGISRRRTPNLVIRGRVQYTDVFGNEYFSEFGFRATWLTEQAPRELDPIEANFPAYEPIKNLREAENELPQFLLGPPSVPAAPKSDDGDGGE